MLLANAPERITLICFKKGCENLILSDKSIMKVMGLGVVKIKMFYSVVHSLSGVAHGQRCVRV